MDETLKALLSSSSFNTFDENPDFNVADALLWIAISLHKIADAINRGNDLREKELKHTRKSHIIKIDGHRDGHSA